VRRLLAVQDAHPTTPEAKPALHSELRDHLRIPYANGWSSRRPDEKEQAMSQLLKKVAAGAMLAASLSFGLAATTAPANARGFGGGFHGGWGHGGWGRGYGWGGWGWGLGGLGLGAALAAPYYYGYGYPCGPYGYRYGCGYAYGYGSQYYPYW
jgi:hypothetical protein